MPLSAEKFCATPGCTHRGRFTYCPTCQGTQRTLSDGHRGSARERGYDHKWDVYSKRWLARFPWCGQRMDGRFHAEHSRCVQTGQRTLAQVTDHIIDLAKGGAHRDEANSQSLCRRCNTAKAMGGMRRV